MVFDLVLGQVFSGLIYFGSFGLWFCRRFARFVAFVDFEFRGFEFFVGCFLFLAIWDGLVWIYACVWVCFMTRCEFCWLCDTLVVIG